MTILKSIKSKRISSLGNGVGVISRVVDWVSTGCLPLDVVMGGGIPIGRMIEIYGDTSTGKSLIAAHILAETQAVGGTAVLIDTENATSDYILEQIGVNLETLIYSVPETVEEVYEDIEDILEAKQKVDPEGLMVVVWDSIAATSSNEELRKIEEKGLGAATVATHARLISKMCRVINTTISKNRMSFVVVNQTRKKIGVLFGDDEATFGGRAVAYYSSVRLKAKLLDRIKEKETGKIIGVNIRVGVTKNKVAPPFRQCEIPVIFGEGMDDVGAILTWLKKQQIVTGAAWKKLTLLDGTEIKFQIRKWEDTYYEHEEQINKLIV